MSRAEYHDKPNGHFVLDADTWRALLGRQSNEARDGSRISGQTGSFSGLPVYIDNCPWDCDAPRPSTPTTEKAS